jgi:hypothetical protein
VDWVALHGPYENAIAVPALLRALRSADPAELERAEDRLENWHFILQEGIYDPAVAAVPFLIEIVADPRVPGRRPSCRLLDLIVRLAGDHPVPRDPAAEPTLGELEPPPDNDFGPYPYQVAAHAAIRAGMPTFITLLRNPDPQLRTAAASLLAHFPAEWATMAPVLADQLTVEDVPSVAAELCTTAGLAGRPGDDRVVAAVARPSRPVRAPRGADRSCPSPERPGPRHPDRTRTLPDPPGHRRLAMDDSRARVGVRGEFSAQWPQALRGSVPRRPAAGPAKPPRTGRVQ